MTEWKPASTTPEWEDVKGFFLDVTYTTFYVEISREEAQKLWEACVGWNLHDGVSKLKFTTMYDRIYSDTYLYISISKEG